MKHLLLMLILFPTFALAWGDTGHEVVCEIAFHELSPAAHDEVVRLLSLDPEYDLFYETCNWADTTDVRAQDHYINLPRGWESVSVNECPMADTCILAAIASDVAILSDSARSDAERLDALKYLGHWLGDIHQPLHVSFMDDRGANQIETNGLCRGNLHGVWDGCLIAREMGDDTGEIADGLRKNISEEQRASWRFDTPVEWVNESFRLTLRPQTNYCDRKDGACWYTEDNFMLSEGEKQRVLTIEQSYLDDQRPIIERRLQQAGVRLGALLNRILG